MSEEKRCRKTGCNNIFDPNDPDAILGGVYQCGDCTREIRRRNRERMGFGYVTEGDNIPISDRDEGDDDSEEEKEVKFDDLFS